MLQDSHHDHSGDTYEKSEKSRNDYWEEKESLQPYRQHHTLQNRVTVIITGPTCYNPSFRSGNRPLIILSIEKRAETTDTNKKRLVTIPTRTVHCILRSIRAFQTYELRNMNLKYLLTPKVKWNSKRLSCIQRKEHEVCSAESETLTAHELCTAVSTWNAFLSYLLP